MPRSFRFTSIWSSLRIADALPDTQSRRVHDFRSCHQRRNRVGHRQSAITVAVPFNANILSRRLDHLVDDEMHKRHHSHRSRVTDRIADHDSFRATVDCGAIHAL